MVPNGLSTKASGTHRCLRTALVSRERPREGHRAGGFEFNGQMGRFLHFSQARTEKNCHNTRMAAEKVQPVCQAVSLRPTVCAPRTLSPHLPWSYRQVEPSTYCRKDHGRFEFRHVLRTMREGKRKRGRHAIIHHARHPIGQACLFKRTRINTTTNGKQQDVFPSELQINTPQEC